MSAAAEVETAVRLPGVGQRFFNDPKNSSYVLPADSEEGRRLNEQHRNICAAAEGTLVFAPVELKDGDHVLDCATGTGIWTLELASQSPPGVSFQGIDISPHLFPPPSHTPSNVSFARESILALPPTFDNAFALVNQRLLIGAFRASEWPSVLQALYRATKPGGWVQLGEIRTLGICDARSDMPATKRLVETYTQKLFDARELDIDCALHIEGWARDAGFLNVGSTSRPVPVGAKAGEGEHNFTDGAIGYFTAITAPTVTCGAATSAEEYLEAVDAMRREWDEVEGVNFPFHWVWAQKPEAQSNGE
ncbi:S-adenosyl-L-methionine-dependent methyltransferase [Exidia glandulosa HHB12029]|uniref:S-adenosyl-L-methionine-dependent methyltransferase n=1 Tax=Exidia glandulosa HHB12029 TaxID=1314781 RepID=A0A165IX82_EXIGL|nr:S-adenosyl-L-methionine-dependent methyltransferase [Exidia glandulosa HHB12029]